MNHPKQLRTRVPGATVTHLLRSYVWMRDGKRIAQARGYKAGRGTLQLRIDGYIWTVTEDMMERRVQQSGGRREWANFFYPVGSRCPIRTFRTYTECDQAVARVLKEGAA